MAPISLSHNEVVLHSVKPTAKASMVLLPASLPTSPSLPPSGLLHRNLTTIPLGVTKAHGNYLTLSNGQKILDATCGAAVSAIGHGNERVKRAVLAQMSEVSYCHSLFFSTTSAEALGKLLVDSTNGEMAKAFIVSSGSEAMEAAMKLARQFFLEQHPPQPNRTRFIARQNSYHGTTIGSLSMSGHLARRNLFEPMLLPNISHVSACNAYRGMHEGETMEQYVERLAQELEDEFQRLGPENVCAFVAEPVVGAAMGCVPSVPGYFKAMRAVCDAHGALLILDEVMCGMGRSGTLHAWEQEGIVPDIQTIGKGLGGGYAPVAGILINHRIINALDNGSGTFSHGQTYQGHPLACAAAVEVQGIIQDEGLVANVKSMGSLLEKKLKERLGPHANVGDIRGRGLFWGIELVRDKKTKEPFPTSLGVAQEIHDRAMREPFNISIYPGAGCVDGVLGQHVLIAPAYNITKDVVEDIVDRVARVIESVCQEGRFGMKGIY